MELRRIVDSADHTRIILDSMTSQKSELIRKKYRYRELILKGKIALSRKAAAHLIGPDCAYHLYRWEGDCSPESARNTRRGDGDGDK